MGPECLLLLHNLGHAELLVELEGRARAIREARAARIRALRQAAAVAGPSIRRAAGRLTGRPRTVDRAPAYACDPACATV
jgi:hypothetical protein